MGQSASNDLDNIDSLSEDLLRQAKHMSEVVAMSYDDLLVRVKHLNDLSEQLINEEGKQLLFTIQKDSDTSVFWKGTVRVLCVKYDTATKTVEHCRCLTLHRFLKVYKSLNSQIELAEQSNPSTSARELTTSAVLRRVADQEESAADCSICLERQPDMLLPCAHSYCGPCLERWSESNKTCPICREEAGNDEAWVMSEAPNSLDVSEVIGTSLMNIAESAQYLTDDSN